VLTNASLRIARRARLSILAAALAAATTAVLLATAPSASAAQACTHNKKDFDLPNKPNLSVGIKLCVWTHGARSDGVSGHANIAWGSWAGLGGKRFDSFILTLRLERGNRQVRIRPCDITHEINRDTDGDYFCGPSDTARKGRYSNWTIDGFVRYRIAGAGHGFQTWQLTGTPQI
jgi:hypothetical protein